MQPSSALCCERPEANPPGSLIRCTIPHPVLTEPCDVQVIGLVQFVFNPAVIGVSFTTGQQCSSIAGHPSATWSRGKVRSNIFSESNLSVRRLRQRQREIDHRSLSQVRRVKKSVTQRTFGVSKSATLPKAGLLDATMTYC